MKLSFKILCVTIFTTLFMTLHNTATANSKLQDALQLDDGTQLPLTWVMPKSSPRALVILQHGMMRHAENMMSLARSLTDRGLEVVLPDLTDEQFLDPLFPEIFAKAFSSKSENPIGKALPDKLLLVGFSAGARFLSHVAALLPSQKQFLRGVLLLDPVVGELPEQQLGPQLNVPYFTILAKPSRCNADGNVFPLLESGRYQTMGFRLKSASHCDFEGRTSDPLCYLYCGLSPRANAQAIDIFASEWLSGLVDSASPHVDYLPGGKVFMQWQNKGLFDSIFK